MKSYISLFPVFLVAFVLGEEIRGRRSPGIWSPIYTVGYPYHIAPLPPLTAVADLRSMSGDVQGRIMFMETAGEVVLMNGNITGLTAGAHGLHIYQFGDMKDGCKSMGKHYNPRMVHHGGPADPYRHVGDLGNIMAGADGMAKLQESDHLISLTGPQSIVGRGLGVTMQKDDYGRGGDKESLRSGNSGEVIACGIIAWAAPPEPFKETPAPTPETEPET